MHRFVLKKKKKGREIYLVTESITMFHPFKKAVARETMADTNNAELDRRTAKCK